MKSDVILGLDVGANSVGWILIRREGGNPAGVVDAGVRAFEEGANYEDYLQGRPASRNADRRMARQRRRLLERTKMRLDATLHVLQKAGLLPPGNRPIGIPKTGRSPLAEALAFHPEHNNPYKLRADALDRRLEPNQLGRVFYHLAQRRGFLSNRKADARQKDEDKERGKVKGAIKSLRHELEARGCTLGQYLAGLDPQERRTFSRIRGRYTSRKMYEDEFEAIWRSQATHHADILSGDFKKRLHKAIFFQRPLKSVKHLIGECELERGRPRTPLGLLLAQRVRLLQEVNHVRVWEPGRREPRPLEKNERDLLLCALQSPDALPQEAKDRLTTDDKGKPVPQVLDKLRARAILEFKDAYRLLDWPSSRHFSIDTAGREEFKGDTTSARLRYALIGADDEDDDEPETGDGKKTRKKKKLRLAPVFGERWDTMLRQPSTRRGQRTHTLADDVVEDVISIQKESAQAARGKKAWGLTEEQARLFGSVVLEDDYSRLSRQALEKLLPHLEAGLSYAEARIAAGYKEPDRAAVNKLPPVEDLRNPIVQRAMAEVRRVVNAVIAKYGATYGKPDKIRIELARDLKRNAKDREAISKKNRENEKGRKDAAARIVRETGIAQPKRYDIEKVLLADECNWRCPYTGECFGMDHLFGEHLTVDVEHIIPFSRSLDDSFMNKTLCFGEENRTVKKKGTPWEVYGPTSKDAPEPERWREIIGRVKNFRGSAARVKLERFLMKEVDIAETFVDQFSARQLNDTRYASRKTAEIVGQLYGAEWRKHVEPSRGGVTAHLRSAWGLNAILSDGPGKSRDDHRHHAIDALCVALTERGTVKMLSDAAVRSIKIGRFRDAGPPWPTFLDDVRAAIDRIVVSHRINRKTSGQMHKETYYGSIPKRDEDGRPVPGKDGEPLMVDVARTPLESLTPADIRKNRIVPEVRKVVHDKLADLAGTDDLAGLTDAQLKEAIKKFREQDEQKKFKNHPFLMSKPKKPGEQPRQIPIHKVRVIQEVEPEDVGEGARLRRVKLGNNSHLEIFEATATRGKNKGKKEWKGVVVPLLEAYRRKQRGESVIRQKDKDGNPLVMSLRINEAVELTLDKSLLRKKGNDGNFIEPPQYRHQRGERVIAVVQKTSETKRGDVRVNFRLHNDARITDESNKENFYASTTSLMEMQPRKVIVTPLGEIRPSRAGESDNRPNEPRE